MKKWLLMAALLGGAALLYAQVVDHSHRVWTGTQEFMAPVTFSGEANSVNVTTGNGLRLPDGSLTNPALGFTSSANDSGLYLDASDRPWLIRAGVARIGVNNTVPEILIAGDFGAVDAYFTRYAAGVLGPASTFRLQLGTDVFANLGAETDGVMVYCSDCTIADPCAGSGTGAVAKRANSVWVCN